MNRLAYVAVVVLLLLGATSSKSRTIADYNTHLTALAKNALQWRAQVQVVDPAKIVVPYHIGKLIEENRKALLQNIDLISLYSTRLPSTRQLSAKIDLMVLVKEVRQDMDDLSDILLEMVSSDQKLPVTWGTTIGNIANGPVGALRDRRSNHRNPRHRLRGYSVRPHRPVTPTPIDIMTLFTSDG